MTRDINYAIKQSLNCMKGSGVEKFTTNDVVDKCFELFYNDSPDWRPNPDSIKNELVKFKMNDNRPWQRCKIVACGKLGRLDLLTWT